MTDIKLILIKSYIICIKLKFLMMISLTFVLEVKEKETIIKSNNGACMFS